MKAVTVTPARELEVREVSTPAEAPNGHLLLEIHSAAINHGDKTFLKMPAATTGLNTSKDNIGEHRLPDVCSPSAPTFLLRTWANRLRSIVP